MRKVLLFVALTLLVSVSAIAQSNSLLNLKGHDAWQAPASGDWSATSAIDGINTDAMSGWNDGKLVTATGTAATDNDLDKGANWWMVDLGEGGETVSEVKIYFQTDAVDAAEYYIEFFDEQPADGTTEPAEDKFYKVTQANGIATHDVTLPAPIKGRYMRLNFTKARTFGYGLKFFEVEVYTPAGTPAKGKLVNANDDTNILMASTKTPLKLIVSDDQDKVLFSLTSNFTLTEGEGYTVDGTSVTADAGTVDIPFVYGTITGSTQFAVKKPIDSMNCLFRSDGQYKTEVVEFEPAGKFTNGHLLFDEDWDNINGGGGFADGSLGDSNDVTVENYFLIDTKRSFSIDALRLYRGNAAVQKALIQFLDADKNEISSYNYVNESNDKDIYDDIYLDKTVEGVRYIKFSIQKITNPAWGARFREICAYGDAENLKKPNNAGIMINGELTKELVILKGQGGFMKIAAMLDDTVIHPNSNAIFTMDPSDIIEIDPNKTGKGYKIKDLKEGTTKVTATIGNLTTDINIHVVEVKDIVLGRSTITYNGNSKYLNNPVYGVSEKGDRYPLYDAKVSFKDETTGSQFLSIDDSGTRLEGLKKGIVPVTISWTSPDKKDFIGDGEIEVATGNWEKSVNIARRYFSDTPKRTDQNGFTHGNPYAKAYAENCTGAANQYPSGLIDGDWMAWNISAEEMAQENKPAVIFDLGYSFKIDEVNIHWNADITNNWVMNKADYTIYGSNGDNGDISVYSDTAEDAKYPSNGWTKLHDVVNNVNDYDVDRHIFTPGEYRFVKIVFNKPMIADKGISMSEINIGGPEFVDADGKLKDKPETAKLMVTTPSFDRSNAVDRPIDNDWIVTSTGVNIDNKLHFGAQYTDCYGRDVLPEGSTLKLYKKVYDAEGNPVEDRQKVELAKTDKTETYRGVEWNIFAYNPDAAGYSEEVFAEIEGGDGSAVVKPITVKVISDRFNINKYSYAYDNARPTNPNWDSESSKEGKMILTWNEATHKYDVKYVRTHFHVNRDENGNAVRDDKGDLAGMNFDHEWFIEDCVWGKEYADKNKAELEEMEKGITRRYYIAPTGDRDITFEGTAPKNAADGSYGSWYVIGYYGDGENMGGTYRQDGGIRHDDVLKTNPDLKDNLHDQILYMDFRGVDYAEPGAKAEYYAKELDMIGLQFEGAFPRDYEVEFLYCEGNYKMKDDGSFELDSNGKPIPNDPGVAGTIKGDWVNVTTFMGMQNMGVGQKETQRIYHADENGLPVLWTMKDFEDATENEGKFFNSDGDELNEEQFKKELLGRIKPWNNVAAVRIIFKAPGTQYGIKLFESAIYGSLNKTVLFATLKQLRYEDAAATMLSADNDNNPDSPDFNPAENYYSFDLGLDIDFSTAAQNQLSTAEKAELKSALKEVSGYKVELKAKALDANNVYMTQPFTEAILPSALIATSKVENQEGDYDAIGRKDNAPGIPDGSKYYTFYVAKDNVKQNASDEELEKATDADHMMTSVVIKNADPSYHYVAKITPLNKDGNTLNKLDVVETPLARIFVPTPKFVATGISLTATTETVNDFAGINMEHDEDFAAISGKDIYNAAYNQVNVASLNGKLENLNVTDDVLNDWNVVLKTNMNIDGQVETFTHDFAEADRSGLNADPDASVKYIKLNTANKKVSEILDVTEATEDIKSIRLNVLDHEAPVTVVAKSIATFSVKNTDKSGTSTLTNVVANSNVAASSLTNVNEPVIEADNTLYTVTDAVNVQDADAVSNHYRALIRVNQGQKPTEDNALNAVTGYFASSDNHYNVYGSSSDVEHGGVPAYEGTVESWFWDTFYMTDYEPNKHNLGTRAYEQGFMITLDQVVRADFDKETSDEKIHMLLTNEYPVILGPVKDGKLSAPQHEFYVKDTKGTMEPGIAPYDGNADHMQYIATAKYAAMPVGVVATGIENIGAENGAYVIYSVDGVLISKGNGDIDTALDALSNGVYVIRANGKSIRYIKN